MGVVFILVERNLLFVSVDAPLIPPKEALLSWPAIGWCGGRIHPVHRPQLVASPAAVSKFKGLPADLLSSAFQWAEVGWC